MKTICINAYAFQELSSKSKESAQNHWMYYGHSFVYDCHLYDIKNLVKLFDFEIEDYTLNCDYAHHSYVKYKSYCSSDAFKNVDGIRLWKYIQNNKLMDISSFDYYLKPLADFIKKPSAYVTVYDIIDDCLNLIYKSIQSDYEYQCSEEYFTELCDINDWMFDEFGKQI
jgi:hypothetical protein